MNKCERWMLTISEDSGDERFIPCVRTATQAVLHQIQLSLVFILKQHAVYMRPDIWENEKPHAHIINQR